MTDQLSTCCERLNKRLNEQCEKQVHKALQTQKEELIGKVKLSRREENEPDCYDIGLADAIKIIRNH